MPNKKALPAIIARITGHMFQRPLIKSSQPSLVNTFSTPVAGVGPVSCGQRRENCHHFITAQPSYSGTNDPIEPPFVHQPQPTPPAPPPVVSPITIIINNYPERNKNTAAYVGFVSSMNVYVSSATRGGSAMTRDGGTIIATLFHAFVRPFNAIPGAYARSRTPPSADLWDRSVSTMGIRIQGVASRGDHAFVAI